MQPEQQRFKDLLRHYAQQRPRQLALRDAQVGFDYAELLEQVEHREALLREWPGEVFALAMGNGPRCSAGCPASSCRASSPPVSAPIA